MISGRSCLVGHGCPRSDIAHLPTIRHNGRRVLVKPLVKFVFDGMADRPAVMDFATPTVIVGTDV
ncbi:hypothetical protein, partial [Halarchaeum acidiphilum]|uniref:hypothetical protein n=1 Tax=Halarchaeum acidiphilum TaxID=489138 RepID=UPI001F2076B1